MRSLQKYCLGLLIVLFSFTAYADVPKVFHVIKAKIKWDNKSIVTYALIVGELNYYDSLIGVYKTNPDLFKEVVNNVMQFRDSISLYSQIYRVKEKGIILLPKDKELKIARSQIQEIALIQYIPSEYSGEQVFNEITSSDSTWLSWKIADAEFFSTGGTMGMCGHTILYFNKPDDASRAVVKNFQVAVERQQHSDAVPVPKEELNKFKKRFRKLRIIVLYYCGC